jgi:multicomponent Na+:H+ antiporter subunit E
MSHLTGYLRYILPTLFIYLGLTQNWEPTNWLLGLLMAILVTALINPESHSPIKWGLIPSEFRAAVAYVIMLGRDLILSGYQLAKLLLTRDMHVAQGIIKLETYSDKSIDSALSAHAITLTPGELVLEIDEDGAMFTHCLNAPEAQVTQPKAQQERQRLLNTMYGRPATAVPPSKGA